MLEEDIRAHETHMMDELAACEHKQHAMSLQQTPEFRLLVERPHVYMDKVQINLIIRALAQFPDQQSRFVKDANMVTDDELAPFLASFYRRKNIDPVQMHVEAKRIMDRKFASYQESYQIAE